MSRNASVATRTACSMSWSRLCLLIVVTVVQVPVDLRHRLRQLLAGRVLLLDVLLHQLPVNHLVERLPDDLLKGVRRQRVHLARLVAVLLRVLLVAAVGGL